MLERVVSGGQSGVDRAALDAALDLGLPCGGWCPKGRLAEDGPLPPRYPLEETPLPRTSQRTRWNVRDSDGTLVLAWGPLTGGTALTVAAARRLGRPYLVLDLTGPIDVTRATTWVVAHRIRTLNVAGPRESNRPGIYRAALAVLRLVFTRIREGQEP